MMPPPRPPPRRSRSRNPGGCRRSGRQQSRRVRECRSGQSARGICDAAGRTRARPRGDFRRERPILDRSTSEIGTIEQKLVSLEQSQPLEQARPQNRRRARRRARSRSLRIRRPSKLPAQQAIAIVAQGLLHKLESGGQFSDELAALENLGVPRSLLRRCARSPRRPFRANGSSPRNLRLSPRRLSHATPPSRGAPTKVFSTA